MQKLVFSFVILTFNSENYIFKCLSAINEAINKLKVNVEVFVVDNGSKDKTRSILEDFKFNKYISFSTILLGKNRGTTYSRNKALKNSSGEFIVILDSDAYVNYEVLVKIKTHLENHAECGLAVPKLVYPDGRFQLSVDQFPTLWHKIKRYFFLKHLEEHEEINAFTRVEYAISAFWMFPNKILSEVGLLDEKIFYSPEDVDYCIRVWKKGYTIDYVPEVKLVHDAQEISRGKGFKMNFFTWSHIKGLFYLFVKHRYFFSGRKFLVAGKHES